MMVVPTALARPFHRLMAAIPAPVAKMAKWLAPCALVHQHPPSPNANNQAIANRKISTDPFAMLAPGPV